MYTERLFLQGSEADLAHYRQEITAPQQSLGDITGDLASRRGMVSGTANGAPGTMTVRGQAPMSELLGYQSRLNALTSGQGRYTIDFSHYEAVPRVIFCDPQAAAEVPGWLLAHHGGRRPAPWSAMSDGRVTLAVPR